MPWINLKYSKKEVEKAGKVLIGNSDLFSFEKAMDILSNWRSFHSYSLNTMQVNLRSISRKYCKNPLIAQRLKRVPSIINKLKLNPDMSLARMQDIAGCRSVVNNMKELNRIINFLEVKTEMHHDLVKKTDYISSPKESGYRSVHLIFKYQSKDDKNAMYNGLQIEVQIRTRIMHSWATAVETAGLFLGTALKSSIGPDEWKQFFKLAGSAFASLEKNPLDNNLGDIDCIIEMMKKKEKELGALQKLRLFNQAFKYIEEKKSQNAKYYLLVLNKSNQKLALYTYSRKQYDIATKEYEKFEIQEKESQDLDVVLVSVDSFSLLKQAYPNYFADTSSFIANYLKTIS